LTIAAVPIEATAAVEPGSESDTICLRRRQSRWRRRCGAEQQHRSDPDAEGDLRQQVTAVEQQHRSDPDAEGDLRQQVTAVEQQHRRDQDAEGDLRQQVTAVEQ
jgi:hypothetical protein